MACRVNIVDGVSSTIHIGVYPTRAERAERVRAMKAHQCRVVRPIPQTQQIPTTLLVSHFTVETEQALQVIIRAAFTIGTINGFTQQILAAFGQHAVFTVAQQ